MRKIAFFVEGAGEMLFVEKLLSEVAEIKDVIITKRKIRGGGKSGKVAKFFTEVGAVREATDENFYVLICDCGGDHLVAQRIREEHVSLTASGYERIIGIRDVRPDFSREDVPKLLQRMEDVVAKNLAPVVFILSMMEVEAWFLAEYSHFERIHPELNPEMIEEALGFNPRTFTASERDHPAKDLEQSYLLKGVVYDKTSVQTTVDKLDFALIYTDLISVVPEFSALAGVVDKFLTPLNDGGANAAAQ